MSERRRQFVDASAAVAERFRRLGALLVEPLRADSNMEMGLTIPEARITAIEGDVGWAHRPPATLACPECDADIYQHRPYGAIDCPECYVQYPAEKFALLELQYLTCSVCREPMEHGRRHPQQFDVPEWATCHNCWYHWEFEHF